MQVLQRSQRLCSLFVSWCVECSTRAHTFSEHADTRSVLWEMTHLVLDSNAPNYIHLFRAVFWVIRTSETSVDNHFTRQYNPEDSSEHHTRRRETLKSHIYPHGRQSDMRMFVSVDHRCRQTDVVRPRCADNGLEVSALLRRQRREHSAVVVHGVNVAVGISSVSARRTLREHQLYSHHVRSLTARKC
jgi:hypothetical protein